MRGSPPEPGAALGSIGGFLARTFVFFALALGVWWAVRDCIGLAPAWLAGRFMQTAFPGWAIGIERSGDGWTLLTSLQLVAPDGRIGEAAVDAGALKYAWGAPLLAALLFATRPRGLRWKLPLGLLALVPFQAFGIGAEWLMRVAIGLGPATALQTGFGSIATNLIAAAYQLGFLVLPGLVPVLIWIALDRRLVAAVMLEGSLAGYRMRR